MSSPSCSTCKHHSKRQRPKVLGVEGDGDMEMMETEEDEHGVDIMEDVYSCKHPDVPNADIVAIGPDQALQRADVCMHYASSAGKKAINSDLERVLAASAERARQAAEKEERES